MKHRKYISSIALFTALVLLTGCSGAGKMVSEGKSGNTVTIVTKSPTITNSNTAEDELAAVQNDSVKVSYPSDAWQGSFGSDPLTIYYHSTMNTNQTANINVQASQKFSGTLTESYMNQLVKEVKNYQAGVEITNSELRKINGEPAIYIEQTITYNDAMIDMMLESGALTEASLQEFGGREAILAIPPTTQVGIYAIADGWLCIYTGTYYNSNEKAEVIDTITTMVQNTDVLK